MGTAFKARRGGGKPKPPANYQFLTAYTYSTNWTVPESGWYKIYCVGKSGDGGPYGSQVDGRGGGGTGGIGISELYLRKGEVISLTVSTSVTSFGSYVSATAGGSPTSISGGAAGNAYGGNLYNDGGYPGGNGGISGGNNSSKSGDDGANGGMKGGPKGSSATNWDRSPGGGGGGGARLPAAHCSYVAAAYTSSYTAGGGGTFWSSGD